MLYELLTGTLPFEAKANWQLIQQIAIEPPPSPRRRRPDCPPVLEAICLHCLQKNPVHRYRTAEALADDLRRYLLGENVETVKAWHTALWWLLTAATLALLLVIAAWWWSGDSTDDQRSGQASRGAPRAAPSFKHTGAGLPRTIGVLVKLGGPRAGVDEAILDGVQVAVDELKDRGENLSVYIKDGSVGKDGLAAQAKQLMDDRKVAVLIGGARPEDRQVLQPLLDEHKHLLLVPVPSENLAPGGRMLCLEPPLGDFASAVARWVSLDKSRKKILWVDDELPMSVVMGKQLGGALVRLDTSAVLLWRHVVEEFNWSDFANEFLNPALRPSLVIGCVHDHAFVNLCNSFAAPNRPTMLFFDLSRQDRSRLQRPDELAGQYVFSTWLATHRANATAFFTRLKANPEMLKRACAATASAYAAVHLWHQAGIAADSWAPDAVRKALNGQVFNGLGGHIAIEERSAHAAREVYFGVLDSKGSVERVE
jgi:ABC-type branched-subunit amino acid transport system substrate-binding protein